jgi:wobble nucleotide-excising tRNase
MNNQFPKISFDEKYQDLMDVFMAVVQNNINKIKEKLEKPEIIVVLEDVSGTLAKLADIIADFNKQIEEYNAAVMDKHKVQEELRDRVWSHIGYLLHTHRELYMLSANQIEIEKSKLQKSKVDAQRLSLQYKQEIATLGNVGVETSTAIKGINDLLEDSGFQGFSMREKPGVEHVYEVVRDDGKGHVEIAQNLSEGEKNFIAFLYFYETVKGSVRVTDASKDKIVIIDDPVSSMDSSALFLVASMVQEMMEVCKNNGVLDADSDKEKYIKQIFILTHNVYFHQQLTYNQLKHYEYVMPFLITKENNQSGVTPCIREENHRMVNYSPVQNTYTALWQEYNMTDQTIPLMNVIRRILDYYFIQLCGFEGHELKKRILDDENCKKNFRQELPDGTVDTSRYQQARAMLAYIDSNTDGISDGLHYVYSDMDAVQCKKTFELIFRCMEQGQHFDMMMRCV